MSGAFRSMPRHRPDQRGQGGGEAANCREQLSTRLPRRTNAASARLPCIFCKLAAAAASSGKKKRPHPKMGPERSGQSPNRKCGKWTREEETPFAGGPSSREEERSSVRCRSRGSREEERNRVTSTRTNMMISGPSSNAGKVMGAMHLMQGWVRNADLRSRARERCSER